MRRCTKSCRARTAWSPFNAFRAALSLVGPRRSRCLSSENSPSYHPPWRRNLSRSIRGLRHCEPGEKSLDSTLQVHEAPSASELRLDIVLVAGGQVRSSPRRQIEACVGPFPRSHPPLQLRPLLRIILRAHGALILLATTAFLKGSVASAPEVAGFREVHVLTIPVSADPHGVAEMECEDCGEAVCDASFAFRSPSDELFVYDQTNENLRSLAGCGPVAPYCAFLPVHESRLRSAAAKRAVAEEAPRGDA